MCVCVCTSNKCLSSLLLLCVCGMRQHTVYALSILLLQQLQRHYVENALGSIYIRVYTFSCCVRECTGPLLFNDVFSSVLEMRGGRYKELKQRNNEYSNITIGIRLHIFQMCSHKYFMWRTTIRTTIIIDGTGSNGHRRRRRQLPINFDGSSIHGDATQAALADILCIY